MEQIVNFAASVSTPVGIIALLIVCCLFAYRLYLRNIEKTLSSDVGDEAKLDALNRLKVPTDRLSKNEQFHLARERLQGQFGIIKFSILAASILALVAILMTAIPAVAEDECTQNIDEARDLVRRPAPELALERLASLYGDCDQHRFTISTIASEVSFKLGRHLETVSWLERAVDNIGNDQEARKRLGATYSSLGYAYERIGRYENALKAHQEAQSELNSTSLAYASSRAASGWMGYLLWREDPSSELRDQIFTDFEVASSLAGDLGLSPQLGLACMHAQMANSSEVEKQMRDVVEAFEAFPADDDRASSFLRFVRQYLLSQESLEERASFPRRCEALTSVFHECECYDDLSARLSGRD